jgi:hypothetical protein
MYSIAGLSRFNNRKQNGLWTFGKKSLRVLKAAFFTPNGDRLMIEIGT